jgi:hypothetical protein
MQDTKSLTATTNEGIIEGHAIGFSEGLAVPEDQGEDRHRIFDRQLIEEVIGSLCECRQQLPLLKR